VSRFLAVFGVAVIYGIAMVILAYNMPPGFFFLIVFQGILAETMPIRYRR
jgi:hypothetical protein